jgi:hypothetical protein
MLTPVWIVVAIVATARGARWKPWVVAGIMLLVNFGVGFTLGLAGYRLYETQDFLMVVGFVTELIILFAATYYVFRPKPSSF